MRTSNAFTLIEMMVVIAIITLMAVLSMPQVNEWIARQQAKRILNQLIADYSKSVSLSMKSTIHNGTSGSLTNRAALYFQNSNGVHSYHILWRNNGVNSAWSLADEHMKTVILPSRVTFVQVNNTSLASTAYGVISFTSTGEAVDNANQLISNMMSPCGGVSSTKQYSARIDLRAQVTDTKSIFYRLEVNRFGEYRVCAAVGSANFGSLGMEVKGI